jgi:hypothetical protein
VNVKLFNSRRLVIQPRVARDSPALPISQIAGGIEIVEAFPRVNWEAVRAAAGLLPEPVNTYELWTELAAQWLELVGAHLNDGYHVYEGRRLLLLTALDVDAVQRVLRFVDDAFDRLRQLLPVEEKNRRSGKRAILILRNARVYYDYIAYFYPEREHAYATSGGVHLHSGYGHVATYGIPSLSILAHELAHEAVSHLQLPRWLDEGWAQRAEDAVADVKRQPILLRDHRLHQRYWSRFGLHGFWDGSAFGKIPSQRLSYQLSRVLFHNLVNHRSRRRQLARFISCADKKDSGVAACQDCFQCAPWQLVEEFLGPGPWQSPAAKPGDKSEEDDEAMMLERATV